MKAQTSDSTVNNELGQTIESGKALIQESLSQKINQLAEKVSETKSHLMDAARDEISEFGKLTDGMREQSSIYAKKVEYIVKRHPVIATLAAAGIGAIVIGMVTKSISNHRT